MGKWLLKLGVLSMISLFPFIYCGGNNGGDNTNNSIKLSIEVPSEITTTEPSIQPTTADIKTITVVVEGSDFSTIEQGFNFPGQIRIFVPIGTNRTFRLLAFDASGKLIFRGTAEGVTISTGENTVSITLIPVVEVCDNGIDDDGDGLIDCADPDCNGQGCNSSNSSLVCINHQCTIPTTPPPSGGTDLSITKSDRPDPVAIGNSLTYSLVVRNNGPGSATGVSVTDTLPVGVTFVSSSATQGTCSGTSVVTCDVGSLAKGASATITIVVSVIRDGTIGNTADVTGNEFDPNLNNNTATQVTVVSVNRVNVDNLVTFNPNSSGCESTSDTTGCPSEFVGKCTITASLTDKRDSPSLSNLLIQVSALTNGNLLQNADGGPGGVGATLTPPITSLNPGESENIVFVICLKQNGEFTFQVDVFGTVQ